MFRLFKIVRLLKLNRVFRVIEDYTGINPAAMNLLQLLVRILFLSHFIACFWFFIGDLTLSQQGTSWISLARIQDLPVEQ